jgi:hypothetical protein
MRKNYERQAAPEFQVEIKPTPSPPARPFKVNIFIDRVPRSGRPASKFRKRLKRLKTTPLCATKA